MLDLSVIVVNYNNLRVLRDCLPSLIPTLRGIQAEILLSDNGSSDDSLAWLRESFPQIKILENGANLGFAEANNRAFAHARGRHVLLLNPDTVLKGDALGPMLSFLDNNDQVGAVGCMLLNPDGSRAISARTFPSLLSYWLQFSGLAWRYPRSRFCGRFQMTYWDGGSARKVDWVCGAALMIKRELLNRLGGLDPLFFLTYDEIDFCHRIKDAGYEVWYTPQSAIVHLDRQSEPQSNPRPEARIKYLTVERNSRVRYFVKHHGMAYAVLVEALHIVANAMLWMKARLVGTNVSDISTMEKGLLLRLYWRTALRLPRFLSNVVLHRCAPDQSATSFKLFVNPYVSDAG